MADTQKFILVTGANSGIGFEVARQLLADASNYVLLGSRSLEKGQKAIELLQSEHLPGSVDLLQIDVSNENSVATAAQMVESKYGRLDALVNNAGIAPNDGTIAAQMTDCLQTNAVGAFLAGEYFAPLLRKSISTPRIINVSSGAGSISTRLDRQHPTAAIKASPYRVSKAAMNMVAACQWHELEPDGFKVFIYGPGFTESQLSARNKVELGAKPTSEGAAPIIEMIKGKRDNDSGKYIEYGQESFPW